MNKTLIISAIAASAAIFAACDNSEQIGSGLVQDKSEVVIDSDFAISALTIDNSDIQSRTISQVLGSINAKGYGTFSSDFVTQFMPTMRIDTDGVTAADIDSVKFVMAIPKGDFVGDSIVPMGLEVYRLNKVLPYPIYSNFDPSDYYDPTPIASKVYTYSIMSEPDSIRSLRYRQISVDLPLSLGQELFQLYVDIPSAFQLPEQFAKHFPGLYVRSSYGAGRVVNIGASVIRLYYHSNSLDNEGNPKKTDKVGSYFAVTPEVITSNIISYEIAPELSQSIAEGQAIVVAPAGKDVQIKFPIADIIKSFREQGGDLSVINSLTFRLPASLVENDYGIGAPSYLLMVPSSQKTEFFSKNKITDNVTSFYATYNSTTRCYNFSSMRPYLLAMLDKEDEITPDDFTFTLTPVNLVTEQTSSTMSYISSITPYVGPPVMVQLLPEKATITLTFSKQTLN